MLIHNVVLLTEAYEVNAKVSQLLRDVTFARNCASNSIAHANRLVGEGIDCGKNAQKSAEKGDNENVTHWLGRMKECAEWARGHREDALIAEEDARRAENQIDVLTNNVLYVPDRITLTDAVNAMKEALGMQNFNSQSRARIATAKWVRDSAYMPTSEMIFDYWQSVVNRGE